MSARLANVARVTLALLRRPDLWLAALRLAGRVVPEQWWFRGPVPSRAYLDYRGKAVYGTPLALIAPVDFIRYVEWCKAFPGPIR